MKTRELIGVDLNYWAAKAEGYNPAREGSDIWLYPASSTMPPSFKNITSEGSRIVCTRFNPTEDLATTCAIAIRERISIIWLPIDNWYEAWMDKFFEVPEEELTEGMNPHSVLEKRYHVWGDTYTETILRCLVLQKFGETVEY